MQTTKRLAIVTGANRGLGFEMCKQLAAKGYSVVLTARDEEQGKEAARELHGQGLNNVEFMQLDTQQTDSIDSFADQVVSRYGGCYLLINNAGIYVDGWNQEVI